MNQFHLTKQNEYVIKQIAAALPDIPLGVYDRSKIPRNQWLINTADWLFKTKWPNGDPLLSASMVILIQRKIFGLKNYNRSHERRLRRTYLRHGIVGIASYLNKIGIGAKGIEEWIEDFEHTGDDIRSIKKLEKQIGAKLLKTA